ncbi:YbhB/YbcL family Raf kinase inhibitor-like protein [Ralstonia sp. 22086]|uniref:YbhB/YbcL family Raf kinase inhibitor-like protein n=1 Tax=Ralstonia TaxID=48736 RepID=UPI0021B25F32|nr:YbhB/YbcL family Raf kinase inhibitor-like protein [Ralstonia wenshanensis]MCT7305073.1 YbhB/YbcL family Raf kinase inhibitor-like protein [Ralstonia wenshanensis]
MKQTLFRALLSLACLSAVPHVYAQADTTFTVESSAFADNGVMDRKYAGKNPANANCTGENVSPPLHWSNVPAGTNSLVLIATDPQGAGGLGVNHWMVYGIPATQTSLPEGAGTGGALRMGQNAIGKPAYLGPCPPKGTGMHHYVFVLIATDLAPDALPNGLTRAELDAAIKGHSKGAAAWIGRFGNF